MRFKKFGRTGLFVSELCLGTMTFGGESGIWSQIGNLEQRQVDEVPRTPRHLSTHLVSELRSTSLGSR